MVQAFYQTWDRQAKLKRTIRTLNTNTTLFDTLLSTYFIIIERNLRAWENGLVRFFPLIFTERADLNQWQWRLRHGEVSEGMTFEQCVRRAAARRAVAWWWYRKMRYERMRRKREGEVSFRKMWVNAADHGSTQ